MSFSLHYFPGNLANLYQSQIIAGNIKLLVWMREFRSSAECLRLRYVFRWLRIESSERENYEMRNCESTLILYEIARKLSTELRES